MRRASLKNRFVAGVFAAFMAANLAGPASASDLLDSMKQTGELKVGWAEWNPFETRDVTSGDLKGVLIDVANEIAKRMDAKAVFVQDNWATLPAGIAAGKFSASIMSITPGRSQIVTFTDPIYSSDFTAIVSTGTGLATWDEVNKEGNTIAATTGSAGDEVITALEKEGKIKADIVRIKDVGAAILAVKTGKNSAYVNQRDVLTLMSRQQDGLKVVDGKFGYSPAGLALPKDDAEALAAFNKIVDEMNADGTTAALFEKNGIAGIQVGLGDN